VRISFAFVQRGGILEMGRLLAVGIAAFFAMGLALAAQADIVIGFDDLIGEGAVPDGYAGLSWGDWFYYDWEQPPYTPHSPPCRVYTENSDDWFGFSEEMFFKGAWFTGYPEAALYFVGYDNGNVVGTSPIYEPHWLDPAFFASGFDNVPVDQVHVVVVDPAWAQFYVMDDVTYATVPEPGLGLTAAAAGLLGLVSLVRRRA
jgi:hypothetical protein